MVRRRRTIDGLAGPDGQFVVRGCLGPDVLRIHRFLGAVHDVIVDAVLDVGSAVVDSKQALVLVSFSVNSSSGDPSQCSQRLPESRMIQLDRRIRRIARLSEAAARHVRSPHDQVLRNQTVGSRCSVGRFRAAV